VGSKKRISVQIFKKYLKNKKLFIAQGNLGKYNDVIRGNYLFKLVKGKCHKI
jgi:hypothetical protein